MKKLSKLMLSLVIAYSIIAPSCMHQHNDGCGYNPISKTGCMHEHTIECFLEPLGDLDPDKNDD